MDALSRHRCTHNLITCAAPPPSHPSPPAARVPAALYGALPNWALLTLLAVTTALAAAQVVVTQIIRLRASNRITRSPDDYQSAHRASVPVASLHRAFHRAGLTVIGEQQRSPRRGRGQGVSRCGGFPSGSDLGSRVGGWPGRSLGSCLTRPVGSHHKGDPPGRPARLEVAHRVRCGA